jgi:hypothetical protein
VHKFPKKLPKNIENPQKQNFNFPKTLNLGKRKNVINAFVMGIVTKYGFFPKTRFPKSTMSWGKAPHPQKGKVLYPLVALKIREK